MAFILNTCADQDFLNQGQGWEGRLKNHLPGLGMSETFFWYLTNTLPKLLLIRTWNAVLSTSIYLPHLAKPLRNNYFQEIPQKLNQICLTIFDPCVISPRSIAIWWPVTTNRHCSHVVSVVTTPGVVFSRKKIKRGSQKVNYLCTSGDLELVERTDPLP